MFPGLEAFVIESNRIEGIGETKHSDIVAHYNFLKEETVTVKSIAVLAYQLAGGLLRDRDGMNVYVGSHVPPPGGVKIVAALEEVLRLRDDIHPETIHQKYLNLHPFMDGNGRTARALWLHTMIAAGQQEDVINMGFLHAYYYQTLRQYDRSAAAE